VLWLNQFSSSKEEIFQASFEDIRTNSGRIDTSSTMTSSTVAQTAEIIDKTLGVPINLTAIITAEKLAANLNLAQVTILQADREAAFDRYMAFVLIHNQQRLAALLQLPTSRSGSTSSPLCDDSRTSGELDMFPKTFATRPQTSKQCTELHLLFQTKLLSHRCWMLASHSTAGVCWQ
jgi:hypothetical protein